MSIEAASPWPFDQPPNCATVTTRQVLEGSEPILFVSHDEEDHGWQFIGYSSPELEDAKLVTLKSLVQLDPTVIELADLPPRWEAIRSEAGKPWERRRSSSEAL
jgi:hypothetical protein